MSPFKSATLLGLTLAGLLGGLAAKTVGEARIAELAWAAVTVAASLWLSVQIVHRLIRRSFSVDVIALLAIGGALALGQALAGAVIAVMFASGGALEDYATARAKRELAALLGRAPKLAHRLAPEGLVDIPIEEVKRGDRLMVKSGEAVPTDGIVVTDLAVLDESALSGESIPVSRKIGDTVRSGAVNAGPPFELTVLAPAAESTYAAIVKLVAAAQGDKAPFVRLADRYALAFVPFSLALAGGAYLLSGDAVRSLAVLVVATPCPLILAAPIAIISGISRAARRGVLIKSGGALETLARAKILLMDKTGTLTSGCARLVDTEVGPGIDPAELLRLAASLDQVSHHVMAATLVEAARERSLALAIPSDVVETPGAGLAGIVDGRAVLVGAYDWISGEVGDAPWCRRVLRRVAHESMAVIFVALDGAPAGALLVADQIRSDAPATLRSLRAAGITKIVMVSGDHQDVAESVSAALGLEEVLAQRTPEEKLEAVISEKANGVTIMVGDGVNDAPSLAAADVGVALGARGSGASSEAADVVLLEDRLDRLAEGLRIAQRSRAIAIQSVEIGMALSVAAMIAAALGALPPVAGAVLQEVIDVVVILNALRALTPPGLGAAPALSQAQARDLHDEHHGLAALIEAIQSVADRLDSLPAEEAHEELLRVAAQLQDDLLPHEWDDDTKLYPRLAEMLGGRDPLASMSRTHREIMHLCRLFSRMTVDMGDDGPDECDMRDMRRTLYSLAAILRLHFAQEEEIFHALS